MNNDGFSLVVPVFNEQENIPILSKEIEVAMSSLNVRWECIWVDDASKDSSWTEIQMLGKLHIGLSLTENSGQSTALMAGIDIAKYPTIITLDADLQNDPTDIPRLLEKFNPDVDVVCGYRLNRRDGIILRKIPSKVANLIARKVTGIGVRDLGCTLRVFRKTLITQNRLVGEMHRVLVIHFANSGARIVEIPVNHRPRIHGKSKYGINRTFKFVADLILAKVLRILKTKPLYFFGLLSLYVSIVGLMIFLTAISMRLFNVKKYLDTSLIVGSIMLCSTSIVLLALGLLGEVMMRNSVEVNPSSQYTIRALSGK